MNMSLEAFSVVLALGANMAAVTYALARILSRFSALDNKVETSGKVFDNKIDNLGKVLDNKIDNLGRVLDNKIDNLGRVLDNKIDNLGSVLDNRIGLLEDRMLGMDSKLQDLQVEVHANNKEMVRRFDQIDEKLSKYREDQDNLRRRLGDVERIRGTRGPRGKAMLYTFHMRKEKIVQRAVLTAMEEGMFKHGDTVVEHFGFDGVPDGVDGTIIVGIGRSTDPSRDARNVFDSYLRKRKHVIFFDKGYTRDDVFRVSIDAFQPTQYLDLIKQPDDRLRASGVVEKPYDYSGEYILFDGASQKYCDWYGLGDQYEWGWETVAQIKRYTNAPIIYRPRPDNNNPKPVAGTLFSTVNLQEDFDRSRLVISHGGNIGWDAVIAGKPHFTMHNSVAKRMSETDWHMLNTPRAPLIRERHQWMSNVMYCQWTLAEISDGSAWAMIRRQMAAKHFRR